ncbi:MAG: VWA domain-containing protein [Bifidobacteriaceae bacterium]|jgi:Mg-chelatase subunit ChlD|nr:VWA domain-containing protein [Bifidobacteriaceae bacterium]
MRFAYPWLLALLPLAVAGVLGAVWRRWWRRGPATAGTRLANTINFAGLPGYATVARQHRVSAALGLTAALVAAAGAVILAARPVSVEVMEPQKRSRDVVLCLDISGSMFPMDAEVIGQFRDIIDGFDGERVAMSWFSSSAVTLFPLTDDYVFIEDVLRPLERQFDAVSRASDWDEWYAVPEDLRPDLSGTEQGDGSSLPGDGLVSCLSLFDDSDVKRSRSVILATDNVVEGDPIFELAEAAGLAADADVHVFALCPSTADLPMNNPDAQAFVDGAEELEAEIEAIGGGFYEAGSRVSVGRIIDSILAQTAGPVEGAPRQLVTDRPGWGIAVLATGMAGVAVWGGWRRRPSWPAWLRRGSAAALGLIIVWNPTFGTEKVAVQAADADILVLVDTSPSVAAEDWDGKQPRLEGVRADLAALAEEYAGAHIGIIVFDSSARLLMPMSTDPGAVAAAADTLTAVPAWLASGSSISAGRELLADTLARLAEEHPERARLVYYLGDGEQTTDALVGSFEQAAELVDGGAVFGYGTAKGGRMRERQEAFMDPLLGSAPYITGPDGEVGVSRIDEEALQQIATELGVPYVHRSADSPVAEAFWDGSLPQRWLQDAGAGGRPVGFILAWVVLGLATWEVALAWQRDRQARQAIEFRPGRRAGAGFAARRVRTEGAPR